MNLPKSHGVASSATVKEPKKVSFADSTKSILKANKVPYQDS